MIRSAVSAQRATSRPIRTAWDWGATTGGAAAPARLTSLVSRSPHIRVLHGLDMMDVDLRRGSRALPQLLRGPGLASLDDAHLFLVVVQLVVLRSRLEMLLDVIELVEEPKCGTLRAAARHDQGGIRIPRHLLGVRIVRSVLWLGPLPQDDGLLALFQPLDDGVILRLAQVLLGASVLVLELLRRARGEDDLASVRVVDDDRILPGVAVEPEVGRRVDAAEARRQAEVGSWPDLRGVPVLGFARGLFREVLVERGIVGRPLAEARVVVARAEGVEPSFLVELLAGEEIRCSLRVRGLLDPGLTEGEVFEVLEETSVRVGDETRAPDVIRMIEVAVLLERRGRCGRIDPRRLHQLGGDPGRTHEDVLRPDRPVADREPLIDVRRFALRPALDHTGAAIVVLVGLLVSVVEDALDAVLLVPDDDAARSVEVVRPSRLVAVGIERVGAFSDVRRRVGTRTVVGVAEGVRRLVLRDGDVRGLDDLVGL